MTIERDPDPEATVKMPRLPPVEVDETTEDFDPEKTLVGEDWETTVIRRIAPRLESVKWRVEADAESFGWESEGLRRLSRELQRTGNE